MSFKSKVNKDGCYPVHTYFESCVMPSGQTIKIEFQQSWSKRKYYYNIYLETMDKQKIEGSTRMESTGKDGLAGLMWARNKIAEFESFVINKHTRSE